MARQLSDINASGELTDIHLDNTTDGDALVKSSVIDTRITDGIADPVETKLFTPIADTVPDTEGLVFYDADTHAISVKNDIAGVTLALGQESVMRVWNATGATLTNASPVSFAGVAGGLPSVGLSIATGFSEGYTLGITTHDIPDGSAGLITVSGVVGGDFSSFTPGDVLYLSDTVAGEYITTSPDLAFLMGIILSATHMLVQVDNIVVLPTIFGHMSSVAGTYNTNTNFQTIMGYANSETVLLPVNTTTGLITVPTGRDGTYKVNFVCSMAFNDNNATREIDLQVINLTSGAEYTYVVGVARDMEGASASFSTLLQALEGDEVAMRIRSVDNIDLTFVAIAFSLESVHV